MGLEINPKIVKISWANCVAPKLRRAVKKASLKKLHNLASTLAQPRNCANPSPSLAGCCMCLQVNWFPSRLSKLDSHAWDDFP